MAKKKRPSRGKKTRVGQRRVERSLVEGRLVKKRLLTRGGGPVGLPYGEYVECLDSVATLSESECLQNLRAWLNAHKDD